MIRTTTRFIGMTGAPYYNTLYFGGTTPGEADAAAAAARSFWGGVASGISTLLTGQVLSEVEFVDPNTGQVTGTEATTTTAITGFATGEPLPPANQGLCRLLTNQFVNGRRLRGRVFIPGPTETMSGGISPTSTYLGYLNTAIAALISGSGGAGGAVIYSPTHRVFGTISQGTAWSEGWAVLRSRRD